MCLISDGKGSNCKERKPNDHQENIRLGCAGSRTSPCSLKVRKAFTRQGSRVLIQANAALDSLIYDQEESQVLESPWKGAEAWHYYILAQRQFYTSQLESSVITCLHLTNYTDILGTECVYSLLALSSLHAREYNTASKAFIKLSTQKDAEYYDNLAVSVFSKHKPINPKSVVNCTNCLARMKSSDSTCPSCRIQFPVCVVSGRPIVENIYFMCHVCKHRAMEMEIASLTCCPLCHTSL
jgi:WD repeat-containing protein 35